MRNAWFVTARSDASRLHGTEELPEYSEACRGFALRTGFLYATDMVTSTASETTYTALRDNLASVLDRVVDDQETIIVRRKGGKDVALVPATELAGLMETAHLLRSPRNAKRLLGAMRRAERGELRSMTIEQLRREVGLEADRRA